VLVLVVEIHVVGSPSSSFAMLHRPIFIFINVKLFFGDTKREFEMRTFKR
jgi:hypothetical protein